MLSMTETTISLAETTGSNSSADILSELLRSMRIQGSVLLNDEYVAPWAIAIPDAHSMADLLRIKAETRIVAFHFVKKGYLDLLGHDDSEINLEAGEIVICFGGKAHQIGQGDRSQPLPVEALLRGEGHPFLPNPQSKDRPSSLTCGVFLLHDTQLNPLFESLPPFLHLSLQHYPSLYRLSKMLVQEVDSQAQGRVYAIERLLEILCAEAICSYASTEQVQGWLKGFHDPVVRSAVIAMHQAPEKEWTVEQLAEVVNLSASRFAVRFSTVMSESPMIYLTKWRMNLASRLLRESEQPVEAIAQQVGYSSLPAFNRVFKKYLGIPPATWRHNKSLHPTVS